MYEVVIGRSEADRKELGLVGTIFLGKLYVKMGAVTSLSNKIYLDVARAHVILIAGKRGTGKSFSLGVIAEEMIGLPEEIKRRLSILIIDTMGIFWTMKFKNEKDEDLLESWDLPKKGLDVKIYTPAGRYEEYKQKGIPTDFPFTIRPSEVSSEDWASVFGVSLLDPFGVLIERTVEKAKERFGDVFDIEEMIVLLREDKRASEELKNAAENRLLAAKAWGVFSKEGTPLKEIVDNGKISILDVSVYSEWMIKTLVVGILCKKLMSERMTARKLEELKDVELGHSYFRSSVELDKEEMPIVWVLLDEAHEFIGDKKTLATDALVTILREGRQPGVCLVMATQQPGQMHTDVLTQTDIIMCHRITARRDVEALNAMMQSYVSGDIQKFLNALPTARGSAVILDDNSEKMYSIQVRPRFTWHGGEAPIAVKAKGVAVRELGL